MLLQPAEKKELFVPRDRVFEKWRGKKCRRFKVNFTLSLYSSVLGSKIIFQSVRVAYPRCCLFVGFISVVGKLRRVNDGDENIQIYSCSLFVFSV